MCVCVHFSELAYIQGSVYTAYLMRKRSITSHHTKLTIWLPVTRPPLWTLAVTRLALGWGYFLESQGWCTSSFVLLTCARARFSLHHKRVVLISARVFPLLCTSAISCLFTDRCSRMGFSQHKLWTLLPLLCVTRSLWVWCFCFEFFFVIFSGRLTAYIFLCNYVS